MAISPSVVGKVLPQVNVTVDADRLRFFAEAIGETSSVYIDLEAARAAGYPDLPLPPTLLFGLELNGPAAFDWLIEAGVDLRRVLHGEQEFRYHSMAFAGEELTLNAVVTDLYEKKGGALEFLVKETEVTRTDGSAVASLKSVTIVQNPAPQKTENEK